MKDFADAQGRVAGGNEPQHALILHLEAGFAARGLELAVRPVAGAEMPTDILLDWNLMKQHPQATYDVQIDDTSRRFEHVVYAKTGIAENYAP